MLCFFKEGEWSDPYEGMKGQERGWFLWRMVMPIVPVLCSINREGKKNEVVDWEMLSEGQA